MKYSLQSIFEIIDEKKAKECYYYSLSRKGYRQNRKTKIGNVY